MDLKLQSKMMAFGAKELRRKEKKAKTRAAEAKAKRKNSDGHGKNREALYKERMNLRVEARHVHLARAFLKGTPYLEVENSVKHPSNAPDWSIIWENIGGSRSRAEKIMAWLYAEKVT